MAISEKVNRRPAIFFRKTRVLIENSKFLSLIEHKIFNVMLQLIQTTGPSGRYTVSKQYIRNTLDLKINGLTLNNALENLSRLHKVFIKFDISSSEISYMIHNNISHGLLYAGKLGYSYQYANIDMSILDCLRCSKSLLFYERLLLYQYNRIFFKTPKFLIYDLKESLGYSDHEYARVSQFKTRVLDKICADLNKCSHFYIKYFKFCEKNSKKITELQFSIKIKSNKLAEKCLALLNPPENQVAATKKALENIFIQSGQEVLNEVIDRVRTKIDKKEQIESIPKYIYGVRKNINKKGVAKKQPLNPNDNLKGS